MNKKVSIIIPCFNGERFIDRCLHSIEIQNYPHIEVVVVNDGSITGHNYFSFEYINK